MWMLGDAHNAFAVKKNPCAGLDLDGNPLEKEAEAEPVNMDTETELEMNDDDMEDFFVDTNELSDDEDTGAMFGML